ncbi:hypothetical protein [Oscillatoria sp. CS-180]
MTKHFREATGMTPSRYRKN